MQLVIHHRIECGEGLIHQEDLGFDRESSSDSDTLTLPARHLAGIPPGEGLQVYHAQISLSHLSDLLTIESPHSRREGDVALPGQPREQGVGLENHADALGTHDRPAAGRFDAGYQLDHRRLAAA